MNKYDELLQKLMESERIQNTYNNYIIKDITFKEWVEGCLDELHIWGVKKKWINLTHAKLA